MSNHEKANFLTGVKQKVIAAFCIAIVAIGLAGLITYYSFNELLLTVDKLAEPNIKIESLNNFFRQITSLDQELRAKAIENPRLATTTFLQESKALMAQLDSLDNLGWSDSTQVVRLANIRRILQKRNKLFLTYLQAKLSTSQNFKTSNQLDSLSRYLINYTAGADTSVITSNKKVTTKRYENIEEEEKQKGFFNRLFSKKKKKEDELPRIEIEEELSTTTDTLSVYRENNAIEEIGQIVKSLEADSRLQRKMILQREIDFIDENTKLLTQVIGIVRDVEQEELEKIELNYSIASALASKSTMLIATVVLIFILSSVILLSMILFDITKTRYYRQQLIKAKEEAENLGKLKQQFLSNMSHEIRTPLQSIIGFSDLAANKDSASEEIKAIQQASDHLLHVVNEILDFTRIDSGKLVLQRIPFTLSKVLDDVCKSIQIQATQKGLEFINVSEGPTETVLLGDPYRLRQILFNLLGNAIKFTEQGFVKLKVVVENNTYRQNCRFVISDSGIGINPEDHIKIFEEFEQIINTNQYARAGSGIGLAIVKSLVAAQYGQIEVDSAPGAGAVFTVTLGFDKAPAGSKIAEDEIKVTRNQQAKILMVDDDALILRFCENIFKKHHIDYTSYQFPKELLAANNLQTFTHILIDIRMPGMRGDELMLLLKDKTQPSVNFIAITAHALAEQKQQLLDAGFDKVLIKPFREIDLLQLISQVNPTDVIAVKSDEGFDFSLLDRLTMNDPVAREEIVQQFIQDTEQDLYALHKEMTEQNAAGVREIIHRLGGRCGQMGATKCSGLLKSIELQLETSVTLELLQEKIDQARVSIKNIIGELSRKS
ncbi:MAG: response regulator [Cytophagia bacterium]|nr:response regulator [Cytophagia bacterium]